MDYLKEQSKEDLIQIISTLIEKYDSLKKSAYGNVDVDPKKLDIVNLTLDGIQNAIFKTDEFGVIQYMNESAVEILGSKKKFEGKDKKVFLTISSLFSKEDVDLKREISRKQLLEFEESIIYKKVKFYSDYNSDYKWVDCYLKRLNLEQGFIISLKDITIEEKSKDIEDNMALRFSNFVNTPQAIVFWEMDVEQNITFVSKQIEQLTGMPQDFFTGKNMKNAPFASLFYFEELTEAIEKRENVTDFESKMYDNEGEEKTFVINASPVFDKNGECYLYRAIGNDITSIKHAEDKMLTSEVKYKQIVDNIRDCIIHYNIKENLEIIDIKGNFKKILGYESDELIGQGMAILGDDCNIDLVQEYKKDKNFSKFFNAKVRKKDGELLDVTVTLTFIVNQSGDLIVQCLLRDNSVQKKYHEELEKSASLLESTLESSNTGYIVIDYDNNVLMSNSLFIGFFNLFPDWDRMSNRELEDKVQEQILYSDNNSKILRLNTYSDAIKDDILYFKDSRIIQKSVNDFYLSGKRNGWVITFKDITTQQQLNNALKESEAKYKYITDNINHIILSIDLYGKINYVSTAIQKVLGYDAEDVVGKNIFEFIYKQDWGLFRKEEDGTLIIDPLLALRVHDSFGGMVYLETMSTIVDNDDFDSEANYIIVCRDVSDKFAAERFMKEKVAAELASQAKSQFLANMSHEIRNPMNAILGLTKSLLVTKLDTHQRTYIDSLLFASKNLLNIINNILDLSKIEENKMELHIENFDFSHLGGSFYRLFISQCEEKQIALEVKTWPEKLAPLKGDVVKLKQIINNLLSNAIKFTDTGTVTISAEIIEDNTKNILVRIDVSDTGVGISEGNMGKIFEKFTQVDDSITKKHIGTGLGLSIAKSYVELMGGSIVCNSKLNIGTSFIVDLPFEIALGIDRIEKAVVKEEQKSKHINILLAEDDMINRMYLSDYLKTFGWNVDNAEEGNMAVELFKKNKYDIILMDGQMPGTDGVEATKRIRKFEKENGIKDGIPIIAITGYALKEDRDKFMAVGMTEYITKPIDETILIQMIKDLV